MSYTNSPLVSYTKLSPNHSGQRTHSIDRITPHCVVGQCSVETLGNIFLATSRQASSNYGIGVDGRVGMYVEEKNRSWCSSSNANDQRAVTIECASDTTEPYTMNAKVYESLINLCTDICRRNGKSKLLWFADKTKTLNYEPKADEMVITVHRWFANNSVRRDKEYQEIEEYFALYLQATGMLAGSYAIVGDMDSAKQVFARSKTDLRSIDYRNFSTIQYLHKKSSFEGFYSFAPQYVAREEQKCMTEAQDYDCLSFTISGEKLLEAISDGRTEGIQESED